MPGATYSQRRQADFDLWTGCRDIARGRKNPRKMRRVARRAAFAFGVRLRWGWHDAPNRRAKALTLGMTYGRYGGVGYGLPAGETRPPIDRLDRLFLAHDKAYATPGQISDWYVAQLDRASGEGRRNR